jgi:hypothetical protein
MWGTYLLSTFLPDLSPQNIVPCRLWIREWNPPSLFEPALPSIRPHSSYLPRVPPGPGKQTPLTWNPTCTIPKTISLLVKVACISLPFPLKPGHNLTPSCLHPFAQPLRKLIPIGNSSTTSRELKTYRKYI